METACCAVVYTNNHLHGYSRGTDTGSANSRRKKKAERAIFSGARKMNQNQYVRDKDLLTNPKNMKIEAERLRLLVGRSMSITRHDYLVEYLASKGVK